MNQPQKCRVLHSLSLAISSSESPICTTAGFCLAPRPSVIYPVNPVNAPMAVAEVVMGNGVVISVAVMVDMENMAYSVGEYAKQAVSWFIIVMIRAECGNGAS